MGFFQDTWNGFTNYLSSTKKEVEKEWDEFQEEIDATSAYDQSTASDVLQQTSNGISFVAEAVGSLINNDSTRELANETIDSITSSELYQDTTQVIATGVGVASKEVNEYLDAHPELKEHIENISETIDKKVDEGVAQVKEFVAEHDEALRNVGALGAVVAAAVPAVKGAKFVLKPYPIAL